MGGMFNLKRFNEILIEYKLRTDLKIVESAVTSGGQLPPKPQLSLMEVWDMYCEYRRLCAEKLKIFFNNFSGSLALAWQ